MRHSYGLSCKAKSSTSSSSLPETEYTGVRIVNVLLEGNEATTAGGAVGARQSVVWFSQSTFIDNVAPFASASLVYEVTYYERELLALF